MAAHNSALWAAKSRIWGFPFTHVYSLILVSSPEMCAAAGEGEQGQLERGVAWYPRGPPWHEREPAVGGISAP